MARGGVPRALGAHDRRARDSAALESWRLRRGVPARAAGAGRPARRSAPAATLARRVRPGGVDDRPGRRRRRIRRVPDAAADWLSLGRTPLDGVRIPRGLIRVRVSKAGFRADRRLRSPPARCATGSIRWARCPPGMVRVLGGQRSASGLAWPASSTTSGSIASRSPTASSRSSSIRAATAGATIGASRSSTAAVPCRGKRPSARFRDATGRPGPATWRSGTYPDGQADFPVGGVSWYEAAAYRGVRRQEPADDPSLVTARRAWGASPTSSPSATSTEKARRRSAVTRPRPVRHLRHGGQREGMVLRPRRTAADSSGRRLERARYMFADYDARRPFERAPGYGFRRAKYIRPLPPAVTAPARNEARFVTPGSRSPVGDDIFAVYRRQTPTTAPAERRRGGDRRDGDRWAKETVAFDAAYGGERVRALLFSCRTRLAALPDRDLLPGGGRFLCARAATCR